MGIKERKEREKEARREEIISAAEKIFFEKGVATTTMDEIAEAAELSKGTLYLYYRSKEDLCTAVALRGTEIMYGMFERALSTGEPTLKLIANLGEAYLQYFKQHRNHFRLGLLFDRPEILPNLSEDMKALCAETDRKVWQLVNGILQRAIDEGILHRGLDPQEAGVMLWSNSNGLLRLMDRFDDYWKSQKGLDLEALLRKSNSLLMEAMMTEKAKQDYPGVFPYHDTAQQ